MNAQLTASAALLKHRLKSPPRTTELAVLQLHQEALEALAGKPASPAKATKTAKAPKKAATASRSPLKTSGDVASPSASPASATAGE